jgi:hypothetical protein
VSGHRDLSVSEATTLLDCSWRWDLGYGGHLAGDALRPRDVPLLLREGRAWGRAMAAYHSNWDRTDSLVLARVAIAESLNEDAEQQRVAGLYDPEPERATFETLDACLTHYHHLGDPLPLHGAETHLLVALPARERHSNRYRLECYLDGLHEDQHGVWVVEFKWRASRLQAFELAARQRQLRWYAWAWREFLGREPVGVILDERLGIAPSPVRLNQNGRPSKVQSCTPEDYAAAGGQDPDVRERLEAHRWQARRRLTFRPGELDQAGWELRSLARLTHQHDTGALTPVRNPNERNCNRCRYGAICDDPFDRDLVDALYERVPPKRDREEIPSAA